MDIEKTYFGKINGKEIYKYSLTNDSYTRVSCLNYGCVVNEIYVPDKYGKFENVVLGFLNVGDYLDYSPYFGAIVGRVAGRIKGGEFELCGDRYELPKNEGENHLHGNSEFSNAIWEAKEVRGDGFVGVRFLYRSSDGTNGYPGNVTVQITYTLNQKNDFEITFEGDTNKTTILNITNHTYFNLSGNAKSTIKNHILTADISSVLELDSDLIPTGKILDATGTQFDFKRGRSLSKAYDDTLIFNCKGKRLARLIDEKSGRMMEMRTDYPCFVLYNGGQLKNNFEVSGVKCQKYLGVCLEAQGYPDAIHNDNFESIVLKPDEHYKHSTTYSFSNI